MKAFTTLTTDKILGDYLDGKQNEISDIYYRNEIGFRKSEILFAHSYDELLEFSKCKNDPIYFIEKYCHLQTPMGRMNIKLRPYQKKIINDYFNIRFNINAVSRQIGMTTVVSLIILHESIFNKNKTIVLIPNKVCCGLEKLDRIKQFYANLPYFLKPGICSKKAKHLKFENGSRIFIESKVSLAIGFNIDSLFVEDAAHIPSFEKLFQSLMPAVSSMRNSRIFISSSPNGYNFFQKMLTDAERKEGDPKKNNYNANRVYWWEVPGRDDIWRKKMIEALGSEELFDQEFDLQFFRRMN